MGVIEGVRMAGTRFGDVEHAESSVAAARRVFAQSFCAAAHAGHRNKGYETGEAQLGPRVRGGEKKDGVAPQLERPLLLLVMPRQSMAPPRQSLAGIGAGANNVRQSLAPGRGPRPSMAPRTMSMIGDGR